MHQSYGAMHHPTVLSAVQCSTRRKTAAATNRARPSPLPRAGRTPDRRDVSTRHPQRPPDRPLTGATGLSLPATALGTPPAPPSLPRMPAAHPLRACLPLLPAVVVVLRRTRRRHCHRPCWLCCLRRSPPPPWTRTPPVTLSLPRADLCLPLSTCLPLSLPAVVVVLPAVLPASLPSMLPAATPGAPVNLSLSASLEPLRACRPPPVSPLSLPAVFVVLPAVLPAALPVELPAAALSAPPLSSPPSHRTVRPATTAQGEGSSCWSDDLLCQKYPAAPGW